MPELPEVETVKRMVEPHIIGRTINKVTLYKPKIISHPDADEFCRLITGKKIESINRRGKFILIYTDNSLKIILHLRMTGLLIVVPSDSPIKKHTHIIFHLTGGLDLRFIDTRAFGRFWLIKNDEDDVFSGINKLGLEPFDCKFNAEYLINKAGKSRRSIKQCLLDQSIVTGIGNIYSDEILFRAKILPMRQADSLTDCEWNALEKIIPEILQKGIDNNSMPEQEYKSNPMFKVYGHAKEPCPICGTPLNKTAINGRSSVYCPNCQK